MTIDPTFPVTIPNKVIKGLLVSFATKSTIPNYPFLNHSSYSMLFSFFNASRAFRRWSKDAAWPKSSSTLYKLSTKYLFMKLIPLSSLAALLAFSISV